jgi:hypothetical protein
VGGASVFGTVNVSGVTYQMGDLGSKVRKTPSWPRNWANFSRSCVMNG